MQHVEFSPIGRRTSRIGLGCGRLVGRSSHRRSARVVEAALDLGIRYFDVAPSYGLGTAEEVIGAVIGDAPEVAIATKVGVPRPPYSAKVDAVRNMVRPVLDRVGVLKRLAQRVTKPAGERPRYDFSDAGVRSTLETSLRKLRRGSVDVLLAHEPHRLDLTDEVAERFERLRAEGLITAYGVGIGAISDRWERFGSIWQSCWPGPRATQYAPDVEHVWHGAVRTLPPKAADGRRPRPAAVVRQVLAASPGTILLVSASTPGRLRDLLEEVDS